MYAQSHRSCISPSAFSYGVPPLRQQLFPDIELSVSGEWKQLESLGRKKSKVAVNYTVSMYDEVTYMIQAVLHQ
jgi:hypothetical protein